MSRGGLETREVWFEYGGGEAALRGISVVIPRGALLAIIGQNGSGKTTLAKHFNGLLRPTRGQVLVDGRDIRNTSVAALARSVGYVFQNPDHQIFRPSTREEIAFGPTNLGLSPAEIEQRTDEALELFGLTAHADRPPASLGFGLRRKVSIAAVHAMHTPYLILDEPTTGLDHKNTTELMQVLTRLNKQGRTIVLITHNMRVVAEYVPRCLVLRQGQVLAYEDTRALFRRDEMLRSTSIEVPPVCELGRRMLLHGLPDSVLTVSEFCDAYGELKKLA